MAKLSGFSTNNSPALTDKVVGVTSTPQDVLIPISKIAALIVPPGTILPYGGSTPPAGFLLCDGAAVSRTTYADLFAVVSTNYGAGNGSSTFNVPNLQGRVPVGRDAGQTEFDTLGETGGEKNHTLTIAEMPSHSHNMPTFSNHNYAGTGFNPFDPAGTQTGDSSYATGGGGSHNNVQPYQVVNYIVKT